MADKWLRFWRSSLALKVFLPTLLLVAIAVTAGSLLLQHRVRSDMEGELRLQGRGKVQTMTYGVENLTRLDELERFLCAAGADRELKGVWLVCGSPARVVASNRLMDRGLPLKGLLARWPETDGQLPGADGVARDDGIVVASHAQLSRDLVNSGISLPAHLLIQMDHGPMDLFLSRLTAHFTHFRLILLLSLCVSLVGIIHISVLRPLHQLSVEVQHAKHEIGARKISEEGADEIGRLARVVKQALLDLYAERSRFELVAERNPALVYRCRNDESWTMEYMSSAVLDLTGRPPQDFIGNLAIDYESVIHPEDRELVRMGVEEGLAGDRTWDIEYRVLHADGGSRPVREQGRGHLDSRTGDWILDGIILDLSTSQRQREMERQLAESERVRQDGLRTMAGSVAHHVNNMLSGLVGGLELAKMEAEAGRIPLDDVRECLAMTGRAASLGRLMLLYTGEGGRERQPVLAGPLVQAYVSARRRDGLFCPNLRLEGEPTSGRLLGNADLLRQLLDHVVDNAREASPGSEDRISLHAGLRRFTAEQVASAQLSLLPDAAGNPFLEIVDEGEGMSAEVLERAFDPFFTTRFTGRGLGLAAVSGIARLHRAGLVCVSKPGEGTRLTVIFPRHEAV